MDEETRREFRRVEAADWLVQNREDLSAIVKLRPRIEASVTTSENSKWLWSKTGWLKDTLVLLGLIAVLLKDSILAWFIGGPRF